MANPPASCGVLELDLPPYGLRVDGTRARESTPPVVFSRDAKAQSYIPWTVKLAPDWVDMLQEDWRVEAALVFNTTEDPVDAHARLRDARTDYQEAGAMHVKMYANNRVVDGPTVAAFRGGEHTLLKGGVHVWNPENHPDFGRNTSYRIQIRLHSVGDDDSTTMAVTTFSQPFMVRTKMTPSMDSKWMDVRTMESVDHKLVAENERARARRAVLEALGEGEAPHPRPPRVAAARRQPKRRHEEDDDDEEEAEVLDQEALAAPAAAVVVEEEEDEERELEAAAPRRARRHHRKRARRVEEERDVDGALDAVMDAPEQLQLARMRSSVMEGPLAGALTRNLMQHGRAARASVAAPGSPSDMEHAALLVNMFSGGVTEPGHVTYSSAQSNLGAASSMQGPLRHLCAILQAHTNILARVAGSVSGDDLATAAENLRQLQTLAGLAPAVSEVPLASLPSLNLDDGNLLQASSMSGISSIRSEHPGARGMPVPLSAAMNLPTALSNPIPSLDTTSVSEAAPVPLVSLSSNRSGSSRTGSSARRRDAQAAAAGRAPALVPGAPMPDLLRGNSR